MKVVQELLGHSGFSITANIYPHVPAGLQIQAVQKLAEAMSNSESFTVFLKIPLVKHSQFDTICA